MNKGRSFVFFAIVWGIGLLFILLKGDVAPYLTLRRYNLDLPMILTAYIYLKGGSRHAGIFAFFQGLSIDVYSAGFKGLFVFLYLINLFSIFTCSKFIHLGNPRGQVLVIAIAWTVERILFFVMVITLGGSVDVKSSLSWTMLIPFLATVLFAPVFFCLFDRLGVALGGITSENSTV